MTIKPFYKVFAALLMSVMMVGANAASVGFDSASYDGTSGQITVNISYDFTDLQMFGGGMDLSFDPGVLSLVSYTRNPTPEPDVSTGSFSPIGAPGAPGEYLGFGIGPFDFMAGVGSAGTVGTFVFDVAAGALSRDTGLVLAVNGINPFVSLVGVDVSAELLGNGISTANVITAPIPVPAAIWFMLSGVGALMGLRRRS